MHHSISQCNGFLTFGFPSLPLKLFDASTSSPPAFPLPLIINDNDGVFEPLAPANSTEADID